MQIFTVYYMENLPNCMGTAVRNDMQGAVKKYSIRFEVSWYVTALGTNKGKCII